VSQWACSFCDSQTSIEDHARSSKLSVAADTSVVIFNSLLEEDRCKHVRKLPPDGPHTTGQKTREQLSRAAEELLHYETGGECFWTEFLP
jgi:hypothetical protein